MRVEHTDKLEVASAQAVDSFLLVLADDAVAERATSLNQEDSIGIAALTVATGARAAVVPGPTAVENLPSLHGDGRRDRLSAGSRRDAALVAQTCQGNGQG